MEKLQNGKTQSDVVERITFEKIFCPEHFDEDYYCKRKERRKLEKPIAP